ncbi:twin-arginine translocase TatA/TatE family subunit [Phreatobacter sp.]|uniref:twin-arginine translocase TatA/TatE family subunit n=1 Tax=Phreatobacter sp. TaxID=1966341 RepID=UPI003F7252B3
MGTFSAWHWILVAIVVLLLFGRGKISEFMGDAAKGIKAFKKGLAEEDPPEQKPVAPATTIDHQTPPATPATPATPVAAPAETASSSAPKAG